MIGRLVLLIFDTQNVEGPGEAKVGVTPIEFPNAQLTTNSLLLLRRRPSPGALADCAAHTSCPIEY